MKQNAFRTLASVFITASLLVSGCSTSHPVVPTVPNQTLPDVTAPSPAPAPVLVNPLNSTPEPESRPIPAIAPEPPPEPTRHLRPTLARQILRKLHPLYLLLPHLNHNRLLLQIQNRNLHRLLRRNRALQSLFQRTFSEFSTLFAFRAMMAPETRI